MNNIFVAHHIYILRGAQMHNGIMRLGRFGACELTEAPHVH